MLLGKEKDAAPEFLQEQAVLFESVYIWSVQSSVRRKELCLPGEVIWTRGKDQGWTMQYYAAYSWAISIQNILKW